MYRSAAFLCVFKVRHVFWHAVTPQCVLGCNLMRKRDRSLRFLWECSSHCCCRWKAGRCWSVTLSLWLPDHVIVGFFFLCWSLQRRGGGLKRLIWSVQEGISRCESVLPRSPVSGFFPGLWCNTSLRKRFTSSPVILCICIRAISCQTPSVSKLPEDCETLPGGKLVTWRGEEVHS